MANPALDLDGQAARARSVGELIAAGRLADLTPEALVWYVDRADRQERQLQRLHFVVRDALGELVASTPRPAAVM